MHARKRASAPMLGLGLAPLLALLGTPGCATNEGKARLIAANQELRQQDAAAQSR